jgi:NAD(P)-dependent dehydrogenase (short-subunit alcohol dehydrogenase family)
MISTTGTRVVILGGTSGIGLATAKAAVVAGASVVVASRKPTSVASALAELPDKRNFPLGYVTTRAGTRERHFYYAPTADPGVVALDEATKETGTAAELATIPVALPLSLLITAPVLIVNGDRDQLICGEPAVQLAVEPVSDGAPVLSPS